MPFDQPFRSLTTRDFRECRKLLPKEIQRAARKIYRIWLANPSHPSLHFKQAHSTEAIWSVRITRGWRALGLRDGNEVTWFWIGSHEDYERMLRQV